MSAKEKLSWSDERAAAGELGIVPSPFLRDDLAFDLVEGGRPEMRRVVKNRKECRRSETSTCTAARLGAQIGGL